MLSDKRCRAARPGQKLIDKGEYGGGRLVLLVTQAGRRNWIFRSRKNGDDRSRKLGEFPAMGLSDARAAARIFSGKPDALAPAGSMGSLLDAYCDSLTGRPSERETRAILKRILPENDPSRRKQARDISATDIVGVLNRYHTQSGGTRVVNKARSALHAAFNHAARVDHDVRRPTSALRFRVTANPVSLVPVVAEWNRARSGVVKRGELRDFYEKMKAREDVTGRFWCLLTLTGQRMAQLLAAAHDPARGLLTLTDRKGRGGVAAPRTNVLPCTPRLRALLDAGALPNGLLKLDTLRKAADEAADGWLLSDIRRTMETVLQEAGVSREHRGALLSHGQGGVQQRHYEQSELLKIKRSALLKWERWVCQK